MGVRACLQEYEVLLWPGGNAAAGCPCTSRGELGCRGQATAMQVARTVVPGVEQHTMVLSGPVCRCCWQSSLRKQHNCRMTPPLRRCPPFKYMCIQLCIGCSRWLLTNHDLPSVSMSACPCTVRSPCSQIPIPVSVVEDLSLTCNSWTSCSTSWWYVAALTSRCASLSVLVCARNTCRDCHDDRASAQPVRAARVASLD